MSLAAIGAIAGGAQALLGIGQTIKGLTMPKPEIPDYDIPDEIYKNMTDAEYWAFQGMPEAQKQQYIDQIAQQGASALSQSSSRKGGLGMVSSIAEQQRQGARDLLSMDVQARAKNQEGLYRARSAMAQAKDTKYQADTNKAQYEIEQRNDMIGAGMQNIGGAFGSIANMAGAGVFDKLGSGGKLGNASPPKASTTTNPSKPTYMMNNTEAYKPKSSYFQFL